MKRLDRMMAILIALLHRPETAQSLAARFEVSRRTILRDIQALSEMGVPICSLPGPSGGYRLMDGYRVPPLALNSREALTVLLALRMLERLADTPFREARWTAIDKIRAVLPRQMLESIEPMLERIAIEMPERKVKTPHLPELMEHAAASRWIRADYRSASRRRWLELKPLRICASHGFWYCEAYSPLHGEVRTFRVDRMATVEAMDGPPPEVPLPEGRGAARQPLPPVRIVARLTYRGALLAEQDEHIGEAVRQIADDEWEVDFHCPAEEWDWAARFFYALGPDAEVTEPEELRREISEMAERVCGRYGGWRGDGRPMTGKAAADAGERANGGQP